MSRILFINSVCNGSTGKICRNIYDMATQQGYECCIAYGRGNAPGNYSSIKIGNQLDVYIHVLKTRLFDAHGLGSKRATKEFLKYVDQYKPNIIHLHNIHGYYINIEMLFRYLKKHDEIKVVWTLHDCWAFTGHCAYWLANKCTKWQKQCLNCKYIKDYPLAYKDSSQKNYFLKKDLFTSLPNINIVAVSKWLQYQVEKSFLSRYSVNVITSGIDTAIFCHRDSDFRQKYKIENKKVILGVANVWDKRKGISDFIDLSKKIDDKYVVVLVGVNKKLQKQIPSNIICINRTDSIEELADIYSTSDIFFNPTKEETYGLTNIEAQACGTCVVSYDAGGTKETLINKNTYIVKNVDEFIKKLDEFNTEKYKSEREEFDKLKCFEKYINLYKEILK